MMYGTSKTLQQLVFCLTTVISKNKDKLSIYIYIQ